jgi:hypothetical protein
MCSYALCATGFAGINRLWIAAHDTEKVCKYIPMKFDMELFY